MWGWAVAFATGLAVIYGLNVPERLNGGHPPNVAENVLYGGFHRLAWAIAVSWVIFACCRGYGGKKNKHLKMFFFDLEDAGFLFRICQ